MFLNYFVGCYTSHMLSYKLNVFFYSAREDSTYNVLFGLFPREPLHKLSLRPLGVLVLSMILLLDGIDFFSKYLKCEFVGYSRIQKRFRCYCPKSQHISWCNIFLSPHHSSLLLLIKDSSSQGKLFRSQRFSQFLPSLYHSHLYLTLNIEHLRPCQPRLSWESLLRVGESLGLYHHYVHTLFG